MTDMSKFGMAAPARIASQPAIDLDTLVRSVLFVSVFLSAWISFHPFIDLSTPPEAVTGGGDLANQLGFSSMFLAFTAWTYCHEPRRLLLVVRPILIAVVFWCLLSVVASWEPATAARRLVFALIVMGLSAMVLLLPKNLRHFSDLMAITVLIVLLACYLGVLLLPEYSIHHATDFLEPEHDGSWRGVFPHKNDAGATMVLFIFVGLYVARARNVALGGTIVVLSAVFLGFSQSKTAIGVLPLALLLSAIIARSRGPALGITLVVAALLGFNLFSVGTVMFEPVRKLVETIIPDATFTGRTEIWELALDAIAQRPLTGYGYSTFWGTEQVVYGMGETVTWANAASDAHNAYLNLAVTIGVPGMLLTVLWVVVVPIVDFCKRRPDPEAAALQMLFLRVCLYGTYASCFESSILQQVGEVWFFFMTSTFGLRYLSVTRATA
ncbi:MAG TPA: O-antigen ligase [Xanthobacteraceae bacterium]|jgi:O-antigen ligase|nr:O-antigen ligase [Xanthobacteraceae bacterium]